MAKKNSENDESQNTYGAEKLEEFKELLTDRHANITQGIDIQQEEIGGYQGELEPDAYDDASNLVEMNTLMALSDSQRNELRQIAEALNKIREGTYGICEGCSELINEPRLKALPFATLCVNCKSQQEQGTVVINRESRMSSDEDVVFRTDDDSD